MSGPALSPLAQSWLFEPSPIHLAPSQGSSPDSQLDKARTLQLAAEREAKEAETNQNIPHSDDEEDDATDEDKTEDPEDDDLQEPELDAEDDEFGVESEDPTFIAEIYGKNPTKEEIAAGK